jgi:hypothetical protein
VDGFPTSGRTGSAAGVSSIEDIAPRDRITLAAGVMLVLGLVLLAVGVLLPQVILLLVGFGALVGGTGTLGVQRRRP